MPTIESVLQAVDKNWIADQAERLVRIPSVTLQEEQACICYLQQLRDLGLDVDVREVTSGRTNLYARIAGTGDGPTLMLNGHLDTIPDQNNQPCYRDGDLLYGRGSTDMKGGMASVLGAVRALRQMDVQLKGDMLVTAVVGHEEPEAEKDGPCALIEDINNGRITCDRIVIVEGADVLWVMSMGSMVFTITLQSDRGGLHTQYVPLAENPIRYMGELINRLHQFQEELNRGQKHPLAGPERIDLGIAQAGDYFNRTASCCTLTGTRRWTPGKNAREILAGLESLSAPIAHSGELTLTVQMQHQREPFETPLDDPISAAVAAAHQQVSGTKAEAVGKRIVGDANLYVHGSGVPTIYYGPSNETAHADVENVSIERMYSAAKVYALATMDFCGVAN